ncbi:hypothetical protein DPM19_12530 [Actinomadura craniellae]|uniref:Uncharacterized protein n=1 Tax=Actinomadura craniellae TaxID=2231787 RepID=A0A365H643_9ACTN|nr:hypothetical protein [Actinomadura craniellae]RAY14590.1 hypothetical protein DPM19_12530 [Actinomadura craniellae]
MSKPEVKIYDIMACNVFWDFEGGLPQEQHKFLVSFFPTPGAPTPDLIEKIVARGPGGYEVEFANQKFHGGNLNGWIHDRVFDSYWYMVNLSTGFMPEGVYTIEVTARDGSVASRSRTQRDEPTRTLVSAYRAGKQKILDSYHPTKAAPPEPGAPLRDVKSGWTTLKELEDVDAYYIYRLSEGGSIAEFNTQRLVWWDNIFVQRNIGKDLTAGLNRGEVTIEAELKPGQNYAYFVETTDSNVQSETNICIFQPHQYFTTP